MTTEKEKQGEVFLTFHLLEGETPERGVCPECGDKNVYLFDLGHGLSPSKACSSCVEEFDAEIEMEND